MSTIFISSSFLVALSLPTELQSFFKKWAITGIFSFIFGLFQTNINTILQQIYVKMSIQYTVYSAGIRTHNLEIASRLP